jgi:DNA repair protein RadC
MDIPEEAFEARSRLTLRRLLRHGPAVLTDAELLTALLTRRISAEARTSFEALLFHSGGLKTLLARDSQELALLPGLGARGAAQLACWMELGRRLHKEGEDRPKLKSPADIHRYLKPRLGGLGREMFHVLCLNTRNTLLADVRVAEGTVDSCPVDPREVFATPIACRASAVILVHNHPSGDPDPSSADIALTAQLVEAGRVLGIRVLDHLIVADDRWVSLLQQGRMPLASGGIQRATNWNS